VLFCDQREVEFACTPAPVALIDSHLDHTGLHHRTPEAAVEPERFGGAHLLRAAHPGVQRREGLDELLLLIGQAQIHGGRRSW